MFCEKCGSKLSEGASFCGTCGTAVRTVQFSEINEEETPPQDGGTFAGGNTTWSVPADPGPAAKLKQTAGSPLFVSGAVLFSFYAFWNLIQCYTGGSLISQLFNNLNTLIYNSTGTNIYNMGVSASSISAGVSIGQAFTAIPVALIAVGLWIVFASGNKRTEPGLKTGGLTLIKVISVIQLIIFCLTILILGVVLAIVTIALGSMSGYEYYDVSIGIAIVILFILLIAGIAAVYIIYYAKLISTLGSMTAAARGAAGLKISVYVIVINFFIAVSNIVSGAMSFISIFSLIAASAYTAYISYPVSTYIIYAVSAIASFCASAAYIIFSAVLIKNRQRQ